MATLIQHSERELNLLLEKCKKEHQDDKSAIEMQELMNNQVLDVIKIISDQCHSGFSIKYFMNILNRLIDYKPILPLTDEEDEWFDCGDDIKQHRRYSSVFKDPDETITDISAIIYSDDGGRTWCRGKFPKEITMPYSVPYEPTKKYIEYKEDGSWEDITDDKDRIKTLYDKNVYYNTREEKYMFRGEIDVLD